MEIRQMDIDLFMERVYTIIYAHYGCIPFDGPCNAMFAGYCSLSTAQNALTAELIERSGDKIVLTQKGVSFLKVIHLKKACQGTPGGYDRDDDWHT
jgi:hypothetical protein